MKIGKYEVGDFVVKEEGGKRHLIFDCRNCVYGASIVSDVHCRYHVLKILQEAEADLVVLAEVYERVYEEKQTLMLVQMALLLKFFSSQKVWSYANLGVPDKGLEKQFPQRHNMLVKIAHDSLSFDPIRAYILCLQEIKAEQIRLKENSQEYKDGSKPYFQTLSLILKKFEETELISKAKDYLLKLKEVPETAELYHPFFEAQIKPSFIGSRLMFGHEESELMELLDEYSVKNVNVQIFRHPNKTQNLYFINPPEYSLPPDKYFILSKTKEVVAKYSPGKISLSGIASSRKYFEKVYESTIIDLSEANQIKLSRDDVEQLSEVVARYTIGYGILEILLNDKRLTDIYLDSPIGQKPIYVVHSDFGQCQTNILYTETEAESLVSKMRAMSGRPFDESHPVLDFDLPDLDSRVAVIGKPLATDGTAFAFRIHKLTPWTLPQLIDVKSFTPLAAGLMSFFIDNQATMLVTGSRGSGKTSLLGALILEIPQNSRIIVQEDTLEIPVPYMKNVGFNVQRLKTRSAISVSQTESEVDPAESLRTALRLGDSALVLGEVRSLEAKVLYEAMRVGAAGNTVIGTIHGDSAYSVWDRVVNDLGVPNTSFKATDIVVVARPIRFEGSLKKHRRLVQVTEVKKHWISDPELEGGLLDLMLYDAKKDKIDLIEDNLKDSSLFSKISRFSGLTMDQMWESIKTLAASKEFLVMQKNKLNIPLLLEAENTSLAHSKLLLLREKQIEETGSVNYSELLGEWKNWVNNYLVKKLVAKNKH
ncbi:MAG: type II/IV secretion system ATPase subunit [archaeon]